MTPTLFRPLARLNADNLYFDQRKFDPTHQEITKVCAFFGLGRLQGFEKEKNIAFSHSNFIVFAQTSKGCFALKFYPPYALQSIKTEWVINQILIRQSFPTPAMYSNPGKGPCIACHGRLAACYSYIKGQPAWQILNKRGLFPNIIGILFVLKNLLSRHAAKIPLPFSKDLALTISDLTRESKDLMPYDHQELVQSILINSLKSFRQNRGSFICQGLHNNASLSNFILNAKGLYALDLAHVQEDYRGKDLVSLCVSCLFFGLSQGAIRTIVKQYFLIHGLKPEYHTVFQTLFDVDLIKEYLKNVRREKAVDGQQASQYIRQYRLALAQRKKSITGLWKKSSRSAAFLI